MSFQDRVINCIDCNQEFVFTAGEQEFYDRKGFREQPKRCKDCREARKTRRDGAGGGGGYESSGNRAVGGNRTGGGREERQGGGGGGQREMFEATCAACGSVARVPFRPVGGRPVYCRDCFSNRSSAGY